MASALKYLHQNNIIHRDLSPSNILLDDFLYPLLADFGISKEITENNDNINNTQKISGFKGIPAYVAPEIWNKYYYSKASDVYSFAYNVFEIMAGQECLPDLKDIFNFYRTVIKKKRDQSLNIQFLNVIET